MVGLSVFLLLLLLGVWLGESDPSEPASSEPASSEPAASEPTSSKPGPSESLTLGSERPTGGQAPAPTAETPSANSEVPIPTYDGTIDGRWDQVAVWGRMLVVSQEQEIFLFEVGELGAELLNGYYQSGSGKVLDIVIGDAYNTGSPVAFVTCENMLLMINAKGESEWINGRASWVRIGDLDGDGYQEVLFHEKAGDGAAYLTLWRYGLADKGELLARVPAPAPPHPFPNPVWSDRDLLLGTRDGKVQVYGWEQEGGLNAVSEFTLQGTAPVRWISGDIDGTIWVSRAGTAPFMEWWEPTRSGYSLEGFFRLPGSGAHAAFTGEFDEDGWLFLIDPQGDYFVY